MVRPFFWRDPIKTLSQIGTLCNIKSGIDSSSSAGLVYLMVRVWYVRHGQSQWNAEQGAQRELKTAEARINAIGDELRFTDSPLSAKGVQQALTLSTLLFAEPLSEEEPAESLRSALRCAASGTCPPPRLLTSNLRRAIDTLLLALRPLLSARSLSVPVTPLLQESSHKQDCTPSSLGANGALLPPHNLRGGAAPPNGGTPNGGTPNGGTPNGGTAAPNANLAHLGQTNREMAAAALASQAAALAAAVPAAGGGTDEGLARFLEQAYTTMLALDRRRTYDERRRVPPGAMQLQSGAERAARLAPYVERLGELLEGFVGGGEPLLVVAHSHLLREMLWFFLNGFEVRRKSPSPPPNPPPPRLEYSVQEYTYTPE